MASISSTQITISNSTASYVLDLSAQPLAIARQYRDLLGNVIPLGSRKNPIIKWKVWTTTPQTGADLAVMPWSRARGLAVIVGDRSGGLVVIDFDKQPDRFTLDTFLAALNLPLDYAWTVQTPGGGFHVYVRAPHLRAPDDSRGGRVDRDGVNGGHIELRHQSVLVTLPPSRHPAGGRYAFMNGAPASPPITVDPAAVLAVYDAITAKPKPPTRQTYNLPNTASDPDEKREVERRVRLEIARRLEKRGSKEGYFCCPQEHGRDGKDFLFSLQPDAAIGGCQGKHAGELTRWTDLAEFLDIDVSQIARDVALDRQPALQRVPLSKLGAHQSMEMAYMSNFSLTTILSQRTIAIKSALGTGKTELVKRLIEHLGPDANILGITHRNALIANLGERMNLDTHRTLPDNRIDQSHRLITTPNSLHKVNQERMWDLVFIDEIEQVLPHLLGGTFSGGESYRAHQVITTVLRNAKRVVILDAHLTNTSVQWLHERTNSAPYVIENTHRPKRGTLTVYKNEEAVLADAITAIEKQLGPVTITVASKARAKVIYRLLVNRFGPEHSLLVTGDNSTNRDIQDFIRHINDPVRGIASLRFLVCTSSFGTGLDVTAPIHSVWGIFHNRPLLSSDMMQMLMRYRDTQQRAAYVQPYHGRDPRTPEDLAQDAIDAAETTAKMADFADHSVQAIAQEHRSIQQLEARLIVNAAVQQTDMLSYFVAFAEAEGFTMAYENKRHHPTRRALHAVQEQIAEETAQRVITATPIDTAQFKQHQLAGTMTEAIIAGHERWKIEQTVGLDINRPIYDDLHTPRARSALRRLTDLITPMHTLKARDRHEAEDRVLLSQRSHYTTTTALVLDGLIPVFGTDPITSRREFTLNHLKDCGFVQWIADYLPQIQRLVDQRSDLSQKPLFVLRRLLKTIGLKLVGQRVMVNGERFWIYTLDEDHCARWLAYAKARLAALTTNAETEKLLRVSGNTSDPPQHSPPLDLDLLDDLGAMYRGERYHPPR